MRSEKNAEQLSKGSHQATVYSRDALKLYKNTICMQGRPSSTVHRAEHEVVHGHCAPIPPMPGWRQGVPAQLGTARPGKGAMPHGQPQREFSPTLYLILSFPTICARYGQDLGQRLPAGTSVQTDPGNIPPTHPSTSNLLGGCLDI